LVNEATFTTFFRAAKLLHFSIRPTFFSKNFSNYFSTMLTIDNQTETINEKNFKLQTQNFKLFCIFAS